MTTTTTHHPLTTIFSLSDTLSSNCFSNLYWDSTIAVILGPGSKCVPSPSDAAQSPFTYFSPGLYGSSAACPDNYTPACSTTLTSGTVTETAVTGCPRPNGLSSLMYLRFTCQPPASAASGIYHSIFAKYGCTMQLQLLAKNNPLFATNTTDGSVSTLYVQPTEGPNAYSVQVRWQASDLKLTTTSNMATATATSTSLTATPTARYSTESPTTSSSLTMGTKIAVGIAIPLFIIFLIIIGALACRKNRHNHNNRARQEQDDYERKYQYKINDKTPCSQVHEVDVRPPPRELDGFGNNRNLGRCSGRLELPALQYS